MDFNRFDSGILSIKKSSVIMVKLDLIYDVSLSRDVTKIS